MPPHNSPHTVSVTLYGSALFQSTDLFWKDCVCIKNESGTENGWWRWDDKQGLFPALPSGEREREGRDALVTAGQQELPRGLAGGALLLYLVREVYSAVVCGQCVWVKIRPVAALSERRQDTFETHERGLSGRLSAGCCSRGQEDETELRIVTDSRGGGEETGSAKQRETEPWHPQNSWL